MCFSATASFGAAAVIGAVGLASMAKAARTAPRTALMFAAIPLLFAAQQTIEGTLWIELAQPAETTCRPVLVHGFVGFAVVFWPVYAPLATLLIEPDARRRKLILLAAVAGAILSAWMLMVTLDHPYQVHVRPHGLVYNNKYRYPWFQMPIYVLATTLAFTFSSHREVRRFGYVVLAGLAVALAGFKNAYVSVWCFFAAAASILVYWRFAGSSSQGEQGVVGEAPR